MGHQADVRQLGPSVDEDDVRRLDVPVRQVLAVQVQQGVGQLAAYLQAVIQGQRLVAGKLLVRLERARNIFVRCNMNSGAGVVAQFHDVIIKRGILVMPPYMQDMDQPRMVAGDGFILENALKFPVERTLVFKILPPYDFDGAPRPGQGFCQPYFSVRAAPYLAHNFMVRNGGSGTHHPLDGQRRQVAAGHG